VLGAELVPAAGAGSLRPANDASGNGSPAPGVPTAEVPQAPIPGLTLRDGMPELTDSGTALHHAVAALASGTGPIAIDTERASGYRYSQRAYLVQIRREGTGTILIDPIAVPGLPGLADALAGPEWVLHAASQDLPCLAELRLHPTSLFDTELAGRLLGMERVGLGTIVEQLLGRSMRKAHGAADWSRRPLPEDWLEYAALDVEVLLDLRTILADRLEHAGKLPWAQQEFEAVRLAQPTQRSDPWRRTSGIHRVRSTRGLAIVQALWQARDRIAERVDSAPGRLLPDSSIVAAGQSLPRDVDALLALPDFHGRGAARHQRVWSRALRAAWALPEQDLPIAGARGEGPPPARAWGQRDPAAAARLQQARSVLKQRADELHMPVENLLSPDAVRWLMWQPPGADDVASFLATRGARPWQVEQTAGLLAALIAS
jgi:ribonuclease D